jgi:hypothetical protein
MYIDQLNVFDAARFHALALILDSRITDRAGAVIVDFAGHLPRYPLFQTK